jgi:hypothetical protein
MHGDVQTLGASPPFIFFLNIKNFYKRERMVFNAAVYSSAWILTTMLVYTSLSLLVLLMMISL